MVFVYLQRFTRSSELHQTTVTFHICVIIRQKPVLIPWLTSSQLTKVKAKRGLGLAKNETLSAACSICFFVMREHSPGFLTQHVQRRMILAQPRWLFFLPMGAAWPQCSFMSPPSLYGTFMMHNSGEKLLLYRIGWPTFGHGCGIHPLLSLLTTG